MSKPWRCPVPPLGVDPEFWGDLLVLTATVLGEAEGELHVGKRAVAHVILNRRYDSRWPDDATGVCLQRKQFSCWNDGSPRLGPMKYPQKHVSEKVWEDCFQAACEAFFHLAADDTNGANHYLAPSSLETLPIWAREDKLVQKIGAHWFYRL